MKSAIPLRRIVSILILAVITLIILIPASPLIEKTVGVDQGIFLYSGSQLLKGRQLYTQIWDHKPPMIFWVQAAGLWLGNGSVWGVWVIQYLFMFAGALGLFFGMTALVGESVAIWAASATWMLAVPTLAFGNTIEEYAIAVNALAFFFMVKGLRSEQKSIWMAVTGLMIAVSFMFKQSLIGFGAAIGLVLVFRLIRLHNQRALHDILMMAAGGIGGGLLICLPFVLNGTFQAFYETAFEYNMGYVSMGFTQRLEAVKATILVLSKFPGMMVATVLWIPAMIFALKGWASQIARLFRWRGMPLLTGALGILLSVASIVLFLGSKANATLVRKTSLVILLVAGILLIIASLGGAYRKWFHTFSAWLDRQSMDLPEGVIWLAALGTFGVPIEILQISLSGRTYEHYFLTLIPTYAALIAFAFWTLENNLKAAIQPRINLTGWRSAIWLALCFGTLFELPRFYEVQEFTLITTAVEYLEQNTQPDDKVLVWGGAPSINFFSGRDSPSRFFSFTTFYYKPYNLAERVQQLLADLKADPPVVILDPEMISYELFVNYDPVTCDITSNQISSEMQPVFTYICENYELEYRQMPPNGWVVYRRITPEP